MFLLPSLEFAADVDNIKSSFPANDLPVSGPPSPQQAAVVSMMPTIIEASSAVHLEGDENLDGMRTLPSPSRARSPLHLPSPFTSLKSVASLVASGSMTLEEAAAAAAATVDAPHSSAPLFALRQSHSSILGRGLSTAYHHRHQAGAS